MASRARVNLVIGAALALPWVVIVAQKTLYDTFNTLRGHTRIRRHTASFPSGGALLPNFSLVARPDDADDGSAPMAHAKDGEVGPGCEC